MIDPKLIRQNFEQINEQLKYRGVPDDFDSWPQLDSRRRELLTEVEAIRAEKNRLGPQIAKAKQSGEDAEQLVSELRAKGDREKECDSELRELEQTLHNIELLVPNIPDSSVPIGEDESANRLEKEWGEKPEFSFTPKPHWEIGEDLGILDFETAAKISGSRFAIYRDDGALLERGVDCLYARSSQS